MSTTRVCKANPRPRNLRPRRARRGQATVEFALVAVLFMGIIYGTLECGRLLLIAIELQNAAREGAQYAALRPSDTAGVQAQALATLVITDRAGVTVSGPSYPGPGAAPCLYCQVQVAVSYDWTSAVAFVPDPSKFTLSRLGPLHLASTATMIIENTGTP